MHDLKLCATCAECTYKCDTCVDNDMYEAEILESEKEPYNHFDTWNEYNGIN